MANILEYLDWRGDIPFSVSPFNEVDNLILAEICYTDFEGVMTQDDTLSIVDAARLYFEIHTEQEILGRDTFYKLAPILMRKASESVRFRDILLKNYINIISEDREEQYSSITFVLPNSTTYIAFRGTDNNLVGWKEDFNLSFMSATAGQKRAVEYVDYYFGNANNEKCDPYEKLILGGHSKGGNFAVYAAAFCKSDIQKRIVNVYSNDGPGFRDEILETKNYKKIVPRIVSILPEESMVGILLSNEYDNKIVKSDAKGFGQHDPFSWQVYGTGFLEAEKRTEVSRVIDKTMMKWLSEISDEDRAIFTDSLFSAIDTTGAKTLEDLSDGGIKIISEILKTIKEMPPEKQTELSGMVKRLVRIGGDMAVSEIKNKAKKSRPAIQKKSGPKDSLRHEMIEARKALPDTEVIEKSFAICKYLMSTDIYKEADIVLAYMSKGNEVDISYLISTAAEEGKKVYIPRVESKTRMDFYQYDGSFNVGKFGIREPSGKKSFDIKEVKDEKVLMILPGVAFDNEKNRVGHGGGYYDRYLERIIPANDPADGSEDKDISLVAVCYDFQIKESVPCGEHDRKVDMLVTESRII
ncbi:MAG: 5-formyltetrahydrofolate cyclo-ligase [Eubacterium sp.]|nr:5-formyltetrahydrofolate cyclo-ligase [Eubacterium sp.]